MSNTPRIDAVLRGIGSEFVRQDIEILINFAKTIERENAGLKVKFERAGHEKRNHEVKLADALDEIKGLRQLVNDCHIVAGQLETERNEARAEIETLKINTRGDLNLLAADTAKMNAMADEIDLLKKELRDNNYLAVRQIIPAEMAAEDSHLEIQRLNAECNKLDTECNKWVKRLREKEKGFAIALRHMSIQIERKDKLVEQMRAALISAKNTADIRNIELIKAALSAAERGE